MNTLNCALQWAADSNLERVIEPLASYISASERPKAALMSALAVLVSEVERTNRAAFAHITSRRENRWS
ncbi:MAG: hypothetical protein WD894_26905 [Pirellulales bacterium]